MEAPIVVADPTGTTGHNSEKCSLLNLNSYTFGYQGPFEVRVRTRAQLSWAPLRVRCAQLRCSGDAMRTLFFYWIIYKMNLILHTFLQSERCPK